MNEQLLTDIGLTPSQAKAYLELIKSGSLTPPQLAQKTGESRTACYMSLAKLAELGLAEAVEGSKKQTYTPTSPSALHEFIAQKRKDLAAVEATYRSALPNMLSYYYAYRGKPGVRFFEGRDGLKQVYEDHLRTGEDVQVVRTPADAEFGQLLYSYLEKRAERGIVTTMISPREAAAEAFSAANDTRLKRTSRWLSKQAYKAPVEISIYGNKVSMISFGEEAIGTIIESPQIAEAMRELFNLAAASSTQ